MYNKRHIDCRILRPNSNHSHSGLTSLLSIAEHYSNLSVPRTINQRFFEDIWFITDDPLPTKAFNFANYRLPDNTLLSDDSNFGLYLFLKVRTFHLLQREGIIKAAPLATSSIYNNFMHARRILLYFLKSHNILCPDSHFGGYRSFSNFTPSLFELLLDEVIQSGNKKSSIGGNIDSVLKYLEEDVSVPMYFRPSFNFLSSVTRSSLIGFMKDDSVGYDAIPEDDYYWIGKSAHEFIVNYAEDIISLHELMVKVWRTEPPVAARNACDVAGHKFLATAKSLYITKNWRMQELVRHMEAIGLQLPSFSDDHKRCWNIEEVTLPSSDSSPYTFYKHGFTSTYCYYLFDLLFGALCSLIFIPTGMRNSEFRLLDITRLSDFCNQDGVYSYVNSIKKIKPTGAFFTRNEIPIPVETWRAIRLLNRLTAPLRTSSSTMICVRPLNHLSTLSHGFVDEYGTLAIPTRQVPVGMDTANCSIAKFSRFIRSLTIPSTHQFRKSIAEFMLRKTKLAPLLICQLFGHRNVKMTLSYLKKNNLISRAVREFNAERFRDGAALMAVAFSRGAAGGPMVQRLHDAVAPREEFQGLTESDMAVNLARWIMSRVVDHGLVILHTPLNLCCRSINSKDIPPCMVNVADVNDSGLPDPANCSGAKCSWAFVTFEQADTLEAALLSCKNILASMDHSSIRSTHLMAYASDFIETYDPILDRIKQVPIADLKRDIQHIKDVIKEVA